MYTFLRARCHKCDFGAIFERGRNVKGRNEKSRNIPDVGSVLVESHLPHQENLSVVNEAGEGTVH
jgi:hypothetical protein